MIQKMKKSKGFTLIEMLVVIAIIAILVAIIVPVVGNSTTKAKAAADAANLRSVASSVAVDYLDNSLINTPPAAPACKSFDSATLKVFDNNGNVEAYFVTADGAYGVNEFAASASTGNAPAKASSVPADTALMVSGTAGGAMTAAGKYAPPAA